MTCSWCQRDEEDCRVLIRSAVDHTKAICDRCVDDVKFVLEHDDEPEPPPATRAPVSRIINLADAIARRAEVA